jgi:hypothetical protein
MGILTPIAVRRRLVQEAGTLVSESRRLGAVSLDYTCAYSTPAGVEADEQEEAA